MMDEGKESQPEPSEERIDNPMSLTQGERDTTPTQILMESELRAHKKSTEDLKWAIRVMVSLVALLFTMFLALLGYALWRDREEYQRAVAEAQAAAGKTAELRDKVQRLLERADERTKNWLEEANARIEARLGNLDRQAESLLADVSDDVEQFMTAARVDMEVTRQRAQKGFDDLLQKSKTQQRINELWFLASENMAKERFLASISKWEEIVKADPNAALALANWARALAAIAQNRGGDGADQYFEQAYQKLAQATAINPRESYFFVVWGDVLTSHAREKEGTQGDILYDKAFSKYSEATTVSPQDYEAWNAWGFALCVRAIDRVNEAPELFAESYRKFRRSLEIRNDNPHTLVLWGTVLLAHGEQLEEGESLKMYKEAAEKFAAALEIEAENYEALTGNASALMHQLGTKVQTDTDEVFLHARETCLRAFAADPKRPEALLIWGHSLTILAANAAMAAKDKNEVNRLARQAIDKYEMAAARGLTSEYLASWASAACVGAVGGIRGIFLGGTWNVPNVRKRMEELDRAVEKFEMAARLEPDNSSTFSSWAWALFMQALLSEREEREVLLMHAKKKALLAEKLGRPEAGMILASICAWLGQYDECRRWLQSAESAGELWPRDVVFKSIEMRPVKGKKWFRELSWPED